MSIPGTGLLPGRQPSGMEPAAMRVATVVISAVAAVVLAGGAALRARTPGMAGRYAAAMSYEEFAATDTARQALWREVEARAATDTTDLTPIAAGQVRWRLLVVAERSCSDAANTVPYLAAAADRSPFIELRLLRKADAPDLLAAHPLGDRQATPLVLVYDDALELRGAWIEQPEPLRAMVSALGDSVGRDSLRARVRAWYRDDAGRTALAEILGIMETGAAARPAEAPPPSCGG